LLYFSAAALVFFNLTQSTSTVGMTIPFMTPESLIRVTDLRTLLQALSEDLTQATDLSIQRSFVVVSIIWLTLNIPIVLLGLVALALPSTYKRGTADESNSRIARSKGTELELEQFLDSFFRKDKLADSLHGFDVDGSSRLVRFFKGGSDALTTLAVVDNQLVVRKIVPLEKKAKLSNQYQWLQKHSDLPYVATALREVKSKSSYAIDLEFIAAKDMFTWIHEVTLDTAKDSIRSLINSLSGDLYKNVNLDASTKRFLLDQYLQQTLLARLEIAERSSPQMSSLINAPTLLVNGKRVKGLRTNLDDLLSNEKVLQLLANYEPVVAIHGDLTVDNILVVKGKTLALIDPSDDNAVRTPAIDFSRLLQSLAGGYEFLNQLEPEEVSVEFNNRTKSFRIDYPDRKSQKYAELANFVRKLSRSYLTPAEYAALDFQIGLLFARMLSHRVRISIQTAPAFLATAALFLDTFSQNKTQGVEDADSSSYTDL